MTMMSPFHRRRRRSHIKSQIWAIEELRRAERQLLNGSRPVLSGRPNGRPTTLHNNLGIFNFRLYEIGYTETSTRGCGRIGPVTPPRLSGSPQDVRSRRSVSQQRDPLNLRLLIKRP